MLLQGYPRLEYLVVDGGSTDGTAEILRRYDRWLSRWVSEPDEGPVAGVNKGLRWASGDAYGLVPSDDVLLPGALFAIARRQVIEPHKIIAAQVINAHDDTGEERLFVHADLNLARLVTEWPRGNLYHGVGLWYPLSLHRSLGYYDERFYHGADLEFLCRTIDAAGLTYLDAPVLRFRVHAGSQTHGDLSPEVAASQVLEASTVSRLYWDRLPPAAALAARRAVTRHLWLRGLTELSQGNRVGLGLLLTAARLRPAGLPGHMVGSAARAVGRWIDRR